MAEAIAPLEISVYSGGAFGENGYLARCTTTNRAVVIDPGATADRIVDSLRECGAELEAIYLTHAHLDHVEGIPAILKAFDVPVYLHPADLFMYEQVDAQASAFGLRFAGRLPPPDQEMLPGRDLPVGQHRLEVRFTPGHSPGHVTLVSPEANIALVGDVIFHRSIGRTDLPGGDFQQLISSIRREILTLSDDTRLLSGHGPETTVGGERHGNPFLISQAPGAFA